MSLAATNFQCPDVFVQESAKVVVVCEQVQDRSVQRLIDVLSSFPRLEPHVIELPSSECSRTVFGGAQAEAVWSATAPGEIHERIVRYCRRTAANLVIVPESFKGQKRSWWRESLAEKLARYVSVLSLPNQTNYQQLIGSQRPVRWLVALDGSSAAEQILAPLGAMTSWLPSEVLLIQPLNYAQQWRNRVASHHPASIARMGVSIADSAEYLQRIAKRQLAGVSTRVCSVSGGNSAAALLRQVNSSAVDAVALGLSNQYRFTRRLTGEFNELIFNKVEKPRLLLATRPI